MAERDLRTDWIQLTIERPEWREADPLDDGLERRFRVIEERGGTNSSRGLPGG